MARIPKEERHAIVDAIVESSSDNMHIIEMRIENIKRVRLAHIKPKNNLVVVAGKNGQGKSSVLDAVAWALTGTSTMPRYPIRKGQRTGSIKVNIGDFIVTRHFTVVDEDKSEKGLTYITKLVVTGKRGENFPSPQVLLDKLLGKIGFDPMAFMRMKDDDQLEELRGLVTFDIDIDKLDAVQKVDYDARREAGRLVDSLKNRVAAMAVPEAGLPLETIDVAAITQRLQNAANANSAIAAQKQVKAGKLEAAHNCLVRKEELKIEIKQLEQQISNLQSQVQKQLELAGQLTQEAEGMTFESEVDTAQVAAELTKANETNAAIQRAAHYRQLEQEKDAAVLNWEAIDLRMDKRDAEREDAIARAKMPIEKLSIKNGEVVYDALPLSQASNAEQIRVSMAIGMAANPKLRVLRISDGSLLDDDSLALVDELAKAHKFQVLIERVETDGHVSVVMEDGNASGDDVEAEK